MRRYRVLAGGTAAALALATAAMPALAGSTRSVQSEVNSLRARLDALEARQGGQFIVPKGTTLTFGGYVKGDLIYDANEALGDDFNFGGITTNNATDHSHFRAHARQSRFYLKSTTATPQGPLKTKLEFDLFGGGGNENFSNSYTLRLRHAYGTWNGWLVGQTWSTFMAIESFPNTLDFFGPVGVTFIRQAQIRYTFPVGNGVKIAVALENSEFSGQTNTGATISESSVNGIRAGLDKAPDFVVAASWQGQNTYLKGAVVLRDLQLPARTTTPIYNTSSKTGWGVSLSGHGSYWPGGKLIASAVYGDGIGRYIVDGFAQDGYADTAGNLQTIKSMGANLAVSQDLGSNLTAGLSGGWYHVQSSDHPSGATLSKVTDKLQSIHATLLWQPVKRVTFGGEIIYGKRYTLDGASDQNTRIQGSVKFSF